MLLQCASASSWDPTSQASNQGSIANTRHNLTQSFNASAIWMDSARNNYGEVCVYCHTPHGANSSAGPLWNHTMNTVSYKPYKNMLGVEAGIPGPESLMCLSCHDGTVAIDSVINMPGSGGYNPANDTGTGNEAFLSTWAGSPLVHLNLGLPGVDGCAEVCHAGGLAVDFTIFNLGDGAANPDLSNDHPVGVSFPGGAYWNDPAGIDGSLTYFETGGNPTGADTNEVRLYGGADEKVECGSCHDPHGVESAGPGSIFIGSFLRVDNAGSTLCLTCHDK
jgi:hypothetical protein